MPIDAPGAGNGGSIEFRAGMWPAWITLACSLALTLVAWAFSQRDLERQLYLEFDAEVSQVRSDLHTRIAAYTQTLRGAAALFAASDEVTRDDWRRYIAGLRLERGYPAIQAVAFARSIAAADLGALTDEVRASGVADFAMRPPGRRDRYVLNVFTEPYVGLNVKALGYDMWQDADRRETMQRARETGEPTITGRTTLKIDEQSNPVPAFIMYLPVVRKSGSEIYGYVLAPFRMPALMDDLLRQHSHALSLSIHDGTDPRPENLFYRSAAERTGSAAKFVHSEPLVVGGRPWTLNYASLPDLEARGVAARSAQVLAAGLVASALLFSLAWLLASTRDRALRLARGMTGSMRESEARFRDLVEQAPDAILVYDADLGHFVDANPQAERLFGCTRDELLRIGPEGFYPPGQFDGRNTAEEVQKAVRQALAGDRIFLERTVRNAQGRNLRCELRLTRLPSTEHRLVRGSFIDVTERKQAEEMLNFLAQSGSQAATEPFFRALAGFLAHSLDMDFVCVDRLDGDGLTARTVAVWCDGRFEDNVTYALKDTPCADVVAQSVCCFPDGVQARFPKDQVLQDLRAESYIGVTLFNDGGRPIGLIAVIGRHPLANRALADATLKQVSVRATRELERLIAEEALRESEEWHRTIVQTAMAGFWLLDTEGRLLEVNDAYCRMSGYSAQELLGMRISGLEVTEDDAEVRIHIQKIIAHGEDRFESRHRRKDGALFDVEVSVKFGPFKGGHFVAFVQDITERKRAEAARALLEGQLREAQKMEAIGTLAGGIAHDFNNILATILGNVELARQDAGVNPQALQSLDEIRKAGSRARDLVQQILAFSRRQPIERKPVALAPIVAESARLLRSTLPARLALDVHCEAALPEVLADATQIQQVVINLATNAMQAMRDGPGRIGIRLDTVLLDGALAAAHPALRGMHDRRPGRTVRLAVSDDGPGMDAATLENIFVPFFTTKAVGEGTGLGLAVVHGVAQGHEGAIDVDSRPGQGTTFTLYLPTSEMQSRAAEPDVDAAVGASPGSADGGRHILYLDDDEALVFLTQRMLERRGYRISGYTDQEEALAALRADPAGFDLVVTDYNMPGLSGLDVARAVRAIRADLPVAVASGFIDEALRAQAEGAGVRELIFKAAAAEDLCEALARLAQTAAASPGRS